jgi:anti-sigma-K factor RskA
MEPLTMHDLTAAYALDALEADEARDYEEHLATCEHCRAELAQLGGVASALAFAVESPAPPDELRSRILETARAERPNVVPLRFRSTGVTPAIVAAAAVAAVVAIGFGIWAASLSRSLDRERSALDQAKRGIAVASDPSATRMRLRGTARGTLFVSQTGDAALVVSPLERAPSGRTYEAWVIQDDKPLRAGTFAGGGSTVVGLERRVPSGAVVAVTLERKPGADTPHGKILLSSQSV